MSFIRIKEDGWYWKLLCTFSPMNPNKLREGVHHGLGCSVFFNTLITFVCVISLAVIATIGVFSIVLVSYDMFFAAESYIRAGADRQAEMGVSTLYAFVVITGAVIYTLVFAVAALFTLMGLSFGMKYLLNKLKGVEEVAKPASNIAVWYRAFKDKYCPSVEVYREDNQ